MVGQTLTISFICISSLSFLMPSLTINVSSLRLKVLFNWIGLWSNFIIFWGEYASCNTSLVTSSVTFTLQQAIQSISKRPVLLSLFCLKIWLKSDIDNNTSSVIPSLTPGTSTNWVNSIPTLSNSTSSPSYVQANGFISNTPPIITLLSVTLLSFTLTHGFKLIIDWISSVFIVIVSLIELSAFSIPTISWKQISFLCFCMPSTCATSFTMSNLCFSNKLPLIFIRAPTLIFLSFIIVQSICSTSENNMYSISWITLSFSITSFISTFPSTLEIVFLSSAI